MKWTTKARVQRAVSMLPSELSYEVYFQVQRHFGSLRHPDPLPRIKAGVTTWRKLIRSGADPVGKRFFEVGTGRVPLVPTAFWLMGAESTVTVDLNPYLNDSIVADAIDYLRRHRTEVEEAFGDLLLGDRLDALLALNGTGGEAARRLLDLARIRYVAPADAADTGLPDHSIDFHTSYAVYEHVPPAIIEDILVEGSRILAPAGLFVNNIDYADHFALKDPSVTKINFLRFSDSEWDRLAGNRYMYMNRLRHDDVLALHERAGLEVLRSDTRTDSRVREELARPGLTVDVRFAEKSPETLGIVGAWIVARPAGPPTRRPEVNP